MALAAIVKVRIRSIKWLGTNKFVRQKSYRKYIFQKYLWGCFAPERL